MNVPVWLIALVVSLALYLLQRIANSLSRIETVVNGWADLHDLRGDLEIKSGIARDEHLATLMAKQGDTAK